MDPILVTGMPRSGTSWISKMLEAGGGLVHINEPLNPQHPPGLSPGVLGVIVVRHPAAVVSSWRRYSLTVDFGSLLEQKELVKDWLEPFVDHMEAARRDGSGTIGSISLLWTMIHHVIHGLEERDPDF